MSRRGGQRTLGRLARGAEIRQVLRDGRSIASQAGNARVREGAAAEDRLCVIASRQVGKAHVRNRVRRVVREILRAELRKEGRPVDLVFRAKPSIAEMRFWQVRAVLTEVLGRAALLSPRDGSRSGNARGGGSHG